MNRINKIVIDSTHSVSDLCLSGGQLNTDKSPYSAGAHRHPYTAIYDMLFAPLRSFPIVLSEIGVLNNSSLKMWRRYFAKASLFGFDASEEFLQAARSDRLSDTTYAFMDVSDTSSIEAGLGGIGRPCDIIIDDSTHLFEHQINVALAAVRFIRPGGLLIIEDVFRPWNEQRFFDALQPVSPYFSTAYFLEANHLFRRSEGSVEPYYDNDKLLVLYRNDLQ